MGSCNSKRKKVKKSVTSPEKVSPNQDNFVTKSESSATAATNLSIDSTVYYDNSTSALFRSIFNIAEPILRRIISQMLLDDYGILRDEKPVNGYKHDQSDDSLPIQPLELKFKDACIVNQKCLWDEVKECPTFEWPGFNDKESSVDVYSNRTDMIVLDVIDFDCVIKFSKGIEIELPFVGPLGISGNLEVGSGGSIQEASMQFLNPKIRLWYLHTEKKAYIAFMERPDIIPNFNVNTDFGRGDLFSMDFSEQGIFDDVVEDVLTRFSPKQMLLEPNSTNTKRKKNEKESFVSKIIVKTISQRVSEKMADKIADGRPYEIDLHKQIQPSIDLLLRKPRDPKVIEKEMISLQVKMKALEDELELVKEVGSNNKENKNSAIVKSTNSKITPYKDKPSTTELTKTKAKTKAKKIRSVNHKAFIAHHEHQVDRIKKRKHKGKSRQQQQHPQQQVLTTTTTTPENNGSHNKERITDLHTNDTATTRQKNDVPPLVQDNSKTNESPILYSTTSYFSSTGDANDENHHGILCLTCY